MTRSIESESIPTQVHGTLLVRPPVGGGVGAASPVLVGFHGYGESAERHLAQLEGIPGASHWFLAAVQALHPFYNRAQEVVASWMTRFDRERAIDDNVAYVGAAVARLRARGAMGPLVYAGFSQGVAMAYRAAARSGHPCAGVIALGGDVPPELAPDELSRLPPVLLGSGRGETFFTPARLEADVDKLRKVGVEVRPLVYQGGHEWTDEFRQAAAEFVTTIVDQGRS